MYLIFVHYNYKSLKQILRCTMISYIELLLNNLFYLILIFFEKKTEPQIIGSAEFGVLKTQLARTGHLGHRVS